MISNSIGASGYVKLSVVGADGKVRKQTPTLKNLILDQGMLRIGEISWAKSFEYCAIGTGTYRTVAAPTRQARISGGYIIYDHGDTPWAFTGALLVFYPVGSDPIPVTAIDALHVDPATPDIEFSDYVVLGVNQTGLADESARTGSIGAECSSTVVDNVLSLSRTFNFRINTGAPVDVTEVGLSDSAAHRANNLFSRISLPAPVTVDTGEYLMVEYTLELVLTPALPAPSITSLALSGIGYDDASAIHNWQNVCLDTVDSYGATVGGAASCMEPSAPANVFISPSAVAPAAFGFDVDRSTSAFMKPATVGAASNLGNGLFSLTKSVAFSRTEGDLAVWRTLGLCRTGFSGFQNGYVVVFDTNKSKTSYEALTFAFEFQWARSYLPKPVS